MKFVDAVSGVINQQEPVVYAEEDFTATTSGDLSDNNLTIDVVGGGWLNSPTNFAYNASNEGVECTGTGQNSVIVETNREDVQVEATIVLTRGSGDVRWQGVTLRNNGSGSSSGLSVYFNGVASDPDLQLRDGGAGGTLLTTWDLSVLLTNQPLDGDTVELVLRCSGDDITFYSIKVNANAVETPDDTYTLTSTPATDHGSGSGATRYGILSNERVASSTERFEYFKVGAIPT